MPDTLSVRSPPPDNVIEDVSLFIDGRAIFHELPSKQGRRRRFIRTLVDAGGNSNDVSGGAVGTGLPVQRERGPEGSGHSGVSGKTVQPGAPTQTKRRRSVRKTLPKSSGSAAKLVEVGGIVTVAREVPKAITMEPVKGAEVVKRGRGRPRKIR